LLHLLAFCVRQFSDKYLKKWYLCRLAVAAPGFQVPV